MYKIYSVFILALLAYIYFMAKEDKSDPSTAVKEVSNVLPLTLINLGDFCAIPTKMETDFWVSEKNLLRRGTTFLADSEGNQVFMCAIKIADKKIKNVQAKSLLLPKDDTCAFPIKFKEIDPLRCFHEPEPIISKLETKTGIFEVKDIPCGPEKRGKMYRFVYQICMTENEIENEETSEICKLEASKILRSNSMKYRSELEIYKFCFDEHTKSVIHTEHRILSPGLLSNRKLKQEREKTYEIMIDSRNYFGMDLEMLKNKYTWLMENQNEQKEVVSDSDKMQNSPKTISFLPPTNYKARKLVSPNNFAFALWRKPTYHYLNFKPMRKELTKIWDHINRLIRDDAVVRNREYYIHTGAYMKPEDQTKENIKKESPEIADYWLQILYLSQERPRKQNDPVQLKAFAILMHNTFNNNNPADTWFDEKCGKNLCENALVGLFPLVGKYVRCCSLIKGRFNETDLKVEEDLEPDFLYGN